MFKQLKSYWPAALCLGGCLILVGCDQAGSGSAETTAKTAAATSEVESGSAADTNSADAAAPPAADDHAGHDHAGHDHAQDRPRKAPAGDENKSGAATDNRQVTLDSKAADASQVQNAKGRGQSAQGQFDSSGELTVRAEPGELNLGEIATGDSGTGSVKLVNFGTEPVRLLECKSSCGCTAADCPRGKEIAAGESVDIEIKMTSGNRPQKITKQVRFMIDGQPQLPVTVTADAVSYVMAEPWVIDRDRSEDGKLVLTAKDDKPFRIVKMHPPIVEGFGEEARTKHEIFLDWKRWEELGSSRRLTFYTDHEKCDKVFVSVQAMYRRPDRTAANAKKDGDEQADRANARQVDGLNRPGAADAMEREKQRRFPRSPDVLIRNGQIDEVLAGIDAGEFDVESPNSTGANLLSVAAQNGNLELIEGLLDRGANIEATDRIGKTPLMWAGHAKDVNVVRALLDAGANVRARDNVVGTALSWTAMMGDSASVRELIEAGADVNVVGRLGFSPLIWASLNGEPETLEALIEAGADVNFVDQAPSGYTALMHAAQTGKADNVKVLIEHDADLETKTHDEKTALLVAAENSGGDVDTVKAIVEAGADLSATDLRGRNALDLARARTDMRGPAVVKYLESVMTGSQKSDAESSSDDGADDGDEESSASE